MPHDVDTEYTSVTISTLDVPGLFSMITGVMAANGINILGAQIYTRTNGFALDILHVNKLIGGVIDSQSKWDKVQDDLKAVLEGRVSVSSLVEKRAQSSSMPMQKRPSFPDRVDFDCEVSREHTVIDIFTRDQIGLLYRITRTLAELGLYIHVAKISTKVDQVADTFYVKDIFGQPINDPEKREDVRRALLKCLAEQSE